MAKLLAAWSTLLLGAAIPVLPARHALAEEPTEAELDVTGTRSPDAKQATEPDAEPPREVDLDRLLQLPSSMSFEQQKRNGITADEWRRRFRESLRELSDAKAELARIRGELDELASGGAGGSQWQVAPPGSNQTEVSPMSFKLREDIRRGKQRVDEAEQNYRALIIEADLAGVPESWRADG